MMFYKKMMQLTLIAIVSGFLVACVFYPLMGQIQNHRYYGPERHFSVAIPYDTATYNYSDPSQNTERVYYQVREEKLPPQDSYAVFFSIHRLYPLEGDGTFSVDWAKIDTAEFHKDFRSWVKKFSRTWLYDLSGGQQNVKIIKAQFVRANNRTAYSVLAYAHSGSQRIMWRATFINYNNFLAVVASESSLDNLPPRISPALEKKYQRFLRSLRKL